MGDTMLLREPWFHVILGILRSGKPATYQSITKAIEEGQEETQSLINPDLLEIDPRWGERQKLSHTLRSYMTVLRRQGLVKYAETKRPVKHVITDDGKKWLLDHGYYI